MSFVLRVEKQSTFVFICDHFVTSSPSVVVHLFSSVEDRRLSSSVEDRRLSSLVEDRRLSSSVGVRPSVLAAVHPS